MASKRLHDMSYGTTMYSKGNADRILAALTDRMISDPDNLFDATLIRRVRGRWKFNADNMANGPCSKEARSIIFRLASFLRHKPFDIVSVAHRHWPNADTEIQSDK